LEVKKTSQRSCLASLGRDLVLHEKLYSSSTVSSSLALPEALFLAPLRAYPLVSPEALFLAPLRAYPLTPLRAHSTWSS